MSSSAIKYSLMGLALCAAAVSSGLINTRQAKVDGVPAVVAAQDASNGTSSSFAKLDHHHSLVEADPQVGTLTAGDWCTTDGTQVNCATADPLAGLTAASPISKTVGNVVFLAGDPCPAGGVWTWLPGGQGWGCQLPPGVSDYTCPAGQFVYSFTSGTPACGTMIVDGGTLIESDPVAMHSARTEPPLFGNGTTDSGIGLALCATGQVYRTVDAGWACAPAVETEVDPKVFTTTPGKWCTGADAGNGVICDKNEPVLAEVDPKIYTTTRGKWCTGADAGNGVICDKDPPATYIYDTSPIIGAGTSGDRIRLDSAYCAPFAGWRWNGASWECSIEEDPTVGQLARDIDICAGGYGPVYNGTSHAWECAQDLGRLPCTDGAAPVWHSATSTWTCGWMPGLTGTCSAGQHISWTGSVWACTSTTGLVAYKSYDFAGGGSLTCETTTAALTGAVPGYACVVGYPSTGPATNTRFTCWVSDNGLVTLQACCTGTCNPPPNTTYILRVFPN